MIVHHLDVIRVTRAPYEADAPLVVDADAVLLVSIPAEPFETIPGWNSKVVEAASSIDHPEFPQSRALEIRGPSPDRVSIEESLGVSVAKTPNHEQMITDRGNNGKRYVRPSWGSRAVAHVRANRHRGGLARTQ